MPFALFTNERTPIVQTGLVHGLVVGGTSVSSGTEVVPPIPLQTLRLQSPGVCDCVGVPAGAKVVWQVPLTHTGVAHSVAGPQSALVVQPPVTG